MYIAIISIYVSVCLSLEQTEQAQKQCLWVSTVAKNYKTLVGGRGGGGKILKKNSPAFD